MDLRDLQRFEFRELIYFVALAEELHLGRAAERVGINISPLSRAITIMERNLGVRLFARTRKGTRLTAIGEALLPVARQMLAGAEHANRVLNAAAAGCNGRLRVAFCENLSALPRVAALARQSREEDIGADFRFEQRPLTEQLSGLRAGTLDIGLATSLSDEPTRTDHDVDAFVLCRDPLMLAICARHVLATEPAISVLESRMGPFILVGGGMADVTAVRAFIRSADPAPVTIEFASSVGLLLTRVAAGDGVGLISACQAEEIGRPDVVFRPIVLPGARVTTYLLKLAVDDSPLVARFIQRARRLHIRRSD